MKKGLKTPPASHDWGPYSGIEDYELKERITRRITGAHKRSGMCARVHAIVRLSGISIHLERRHPEFLSSSLGDVQLVSFQKL